VVNINTTVFWDVVLWTVPV